MKKKSRKERTRISVARSLEQQVALKVGENSPFTAANYKKVKHSVCQYLGKKADKLTLTDLTGECISDYVVHIQQSGKLSANSVYCYLRTFRAMYNRSLLCVSEKYKGENPFSGIRILVPPTLKRSISKEEMNALLARDLSDMPEMAKARDLFFFMFLTCGMCFIDVYKLEKHNVSGGYINYVRNKTKAPLRVKINAEIQQLLDKYTEEDSPYLFPFLRRHQYDQTKTVDEPSSLRRINRQLEKLGALLNFSIPLTTYVARHTWATFTEESGTSISVISQGLGHTSERVTRIYMKGLPSPVVDQANENMLNLMIRRKEGRRKKEKCLVLCKNKTSVANSQYKP